MTAPSSSTTEAYDCKGRKTNGIQIAVFADKHGNPTTPQACAQILQFKKQHGHWQNVSACQIQPLSEETHKAVLDFMGRLLSYISSTQAVAGSSIAGVAYTVLNAKGKHIFEIPAITSEQLQGIFEDIVKWEVQQTITQEAFAQLQPKQANPEGIYTLDFIAVQKQFPEVSSKMILKPFFANTDFLELTLYCTHVPPWLYKEKSLRCTQTHNSIGYQVLIQKAETRKDTI